MLTGWRKSLSKCFLIPQRYVLGIMGFFNIVMAYCMRACLSVAITEMVITSASSDSPDSCSHLDTNTTSTSHSPHSNKIYDWSETTQGLILSSFFWGYIVTHIPGGILAEKYGGKYTLGLGTLFAAVCTLITPFTVDYGYGWLIFLRICVGLGEGTLYPALNTLLGKWVPAHERGTIGTIAFAGTQIGTIAANSLSGYLISTTNSWESVFYFFGGLGILCFILFTLLCYSEPDQHPFISEEEKIFLKEAIDTVSDQDKVVPWKQILTSVPVWGLVAAQIGHDWGFFAMVIDLPKYMADILKYNVAENGVWSSLPHVVMWILSLGSGWLCDWLIIKGYMELTFARKFFTSTGAILPGIFMLAASYAGCDRAAVIAMFTLSMGTMGTYYCGMKVNALDLAPNYAGAVMAIVNGLGAVSGIIIPYLIGVLTEDHTVLEWRLVFWITMVVFVVTTIIFVIYGTGEEQWWNNPDHPKFGKHVEMVHYDAVNPKPEEEVDMTSVIL